MKFANVNCLIGCTFWNALDINLSSVSLLKDTDCQLCGQAVTVKISTKTLHFPRKIRRHNYGKSRRGNWEAREIHFYQSVAMAASANVRHNNNCFWIKSLTLHSDTEQQCCLRTLHILLPFNLNTFLYPKPQRPYI
jgi:hypothetical protein